MISVIVGIVTQGDMMKGDMMAIIMICYQCCYPYHYDIGHPVAAGGCL